MQPQKKLSSHPLLSQADDIAAARDPLLLVGRVLVASVFLFTVGTGSPTAGYLASLGVPAPAFWSALAQAVEWIISLSLILGLATRYGALLALIYVVIASALAHRYWQYPEAQQTVQYIFLTKNLAIAGGLVLVLVTGPGRWSVDRILAER